MVGSLALLLGPIEAKAINASRWPWRTDLYVPCLCGLAFLTVSFTNHPTVCKKADGFKVIRLSGRHPHHTSGFYASSISEAENPCRNRELLKHIPIIMQ